MPWFGISDGNPNRLYWAVLVGVGGTGLIPGCSRDNWGVGYYYDTFSLDLTDVLAPSVTLRSEQGVETFYNFAAPRVQHRGRLADYSPRTRE